MILALRYLFVYRLAVIYLWNLARCRLSGNLNCLSTFKNFYMSLMLKWSAS